MFPPAVGCTYAANKIVLAPAPQPFSTCFLAPCLSVLPMSAGYGDLLGKTVLYSAANASEVLRSPLTFFSLFNSFFARPTSSIPPLCHFKSVLGFSHFVTHQLARLLPKQCNPFVWVATSNSAPTLWQLTTQHRLGLVGASGVLGVLACTVFFSNKRLLLLIPFSFAGPQHYRLLNMDALRALCSPAAAPVATPGHGMITNEGTSCPKQYIHILIL